ncbi:GNAT family N-acetyltransferase [Microbacterium sp. JC 701]|uniref:GNAT family N-acetyltransferase n=1 Tax=Microbacterium sp. JC 701 TaxID=2897389 RepID=UPI001E501350|nr:GNAT family protein [Microbacterium sp. JC 701]MCD2168501.1 GNAT family N-acetyltransferase [Microbacterium sp. JC 701]
MADDAIHDTDSALAYGSALLHGERVRLRGLTDADLDPLVDWWRRSDSAALQQNSVTVRPEAAVREMFQIWSRNDSPGGAGFSIDDETGNLIGHATLWGATLPARVATFAIVIGPDAVGRGYGTDATRTMLRYAFDELGVRKVELRVWAFNDRAIRAYEKAGFVREGVRRQVAFHGGRFHDEVLMGVLAEEFRGR